MEEHNKHSGFVIIGCGKCCGVFHRQTSLNMVQEIAIEAVPKFLFNLSALVNGIKALRFQNRKRISETADAVKNTGNFMLYGTIVSQKMRTDKKNQDAIAAQFPVYLYAFSTHL